MIKKVKLRGWKSHLDSELSFSPGVNALVGIMGSGKSSVMDAISFGLFGTFPSLTTRRVGIDDLIMKKPQKKGEASVEIDFHSGGSEYSVKRDLKRGKGTTYAEIRRNGELIEVSPKRVTEIVEQLLQIDYDVFSKAVYSEQNSLDYFLKIPAGQRRQHIDRMLKVDRFEIVREQTVALLNKVKQGIDERMRVIVDIEKEGIEEKIGKVSKDLKELEERVKEIEKKKEIMGNGRSWAEKKVAAFEVKEEELNKIKVRIEGGKGGLKQVEEGIKKANEFLEGMDKDVDKKMESLRNGIKSKKEEVERRRKALYEAKSKISVLREGIEKLSKTGDRCFVCDSHITEEKRVALGREREEEMEKLEAIVSKEDVIELTGRLEEMEDQLKGMEMEENKAKDVAKEIKDMKEKREELLSSMEVLEEKILEMEEELGKTGIKKLREELQEIVAKERQLSTEADMLEERKRDKTSLLEELQNREGMLKEYREEVKDDGKAVEALDKFKGVLRVTQEQLRREFLETVNYIMEKLWGELYPYGDFHGVRLFVEGGDYVLQLKDEEDWVNADGIASGGERSIACLALRIAFSLAFIPNLKWLILDEPTHNLDSNAIQQFSNILREKMHEFAEQVFLITHEDRLSDGITGSLYRLERDKASGGATQFKGV
jgi:exonuclease SbcC